RLPMQHISVAGTMRWSLAGLHSVVITNCVLKRLALSMLLLIDFRFFDRDGWICGICDDPVDRAMEYPDPMSVSLDHIIPLSKGGSHTPENVQCAHLDCNLRKGVDHGERRELERSA